MRFALLLRRPQLVFIGGIGLVFALALYFRAGQLSFFFLSDDFDLIEFVAEHGAFGVWSSRGAAFFRPLISCSIFVDYRIWGSNPFGFHLTNLLLHASNACLISWIVWLLLCDGQRQSMTLTDLITSVAAGSCFAVSPTLGESVVWIAGRTDLIASFFSLLTFSFFVSWRQSGNVAFSVVAFACLALALLSKESAATLPFVLLCCEICRQWRVKSWRPRLIAGYGLVAIALVGVYIVVRSSVIGALVGGYGEAVHLNLSTIPLNLAKVFGHMFIMAPFRQAFLVTVGIVGGLLLVVALRWWRDPAPERGVYSLPFLLSILSLISFLPASTFLIGRFMPSGFGFRTLYLPAAFGFIAMAALIRLAVPHAGALAIIGVIVVVSYAGCLSHSYGYWFEASQIAESIVTGLRRLPAPKGPETVLVMNLPEMTQKGGVHIFRNGLESAGRLFDDPMRQRKFVRVSRQEIAALSDKTRVEKKDTTYTMRFASGNSRLLTYFDPWAPTPADTPWYTLPEVAEHKLVMQLKATTTDPLPLFRILSFSGGSLVDVSE